MFRPLAPLIDPGTACTASASNQVPTNSDWARLYPELERLYVHERRKLRYIIEYVDTKYGFKTTQQMFKKRFAKWGFQKNAKRSVSPTSTSSVIKCAKTSSPRLIPNSPSSGTDDRLFLQFLINVRTWNTSFYESVHSDGSYVADFRKSWPERSHEMSCTFKLAVDLLNRGQGDLAGRMARKAFLLAEEMLMLDGPVVMWNLLEIMHYMITLSHLRLVRLLFVHLMALVDVKMPKNHPLPTMLRTLRTFLASPRRPMPTLSINSATDPLSSSLFDDSQEASVVGNSFFSDTFLCMIKQAWTLNAEILFKNFDHRLFQLYLRIHWESCSIEPPMAIVDAAKKWLIETTLRQHSSGGSETDQSSGLIQVIPFDQDRAFQSMFTVPTNASAPQCYEKLRDISMARFRFHANAILSEGSNSRYETRTLLCILAALITAKIMEDWAIRKGSLDIEGEGLPKISRGQAGVVATAMRMSMELDAEHTGLKEPWCTVEQTRSIVSLREYASPQADPRVIREMWRLEDELTAAGEQQKALEAKETTYQRLKEFLGDIPATSV